jgi:tetratricopeptide (TPR) repeat protein
LESDPALPDKAIKDLAEKEKNNAMAQYLAGKIYLVNGDLEKAAQMFLAARDYDQLRFRAPGELNNIIRKQAGDKRTILVDLDSVFRVHSPDGIPGSELITEHVHPNARGYFLMADAFYAALISKQIILPGKYISGEEAFEIMPVIRVDSVYAYLGISLLTHSWPFTDRGADKDSLLASFRVVSVPDSLGMLVFNRQINWLVAMNEYYRYCMNTGSYREALRASEAVKTEVRYSGIPYNMAARAYELMGRTDKATEELRIGFGLDPLPEIAYNLSGYLLQSGLLRESAEYLEYAVSRG